MQSTIAGLDVSRVLGRLVWYIALAGAVPLGGCGGMSSLTSGVGGGVLGGSSPQPAEVTAVTEEQMLAAVKADEGVTGSTAGSEIAYGCPRFTVWQRDSNLTIYEPGRVGDGLAVVERGEITKTARECQIEPGRVTVKVGLAGRVLLGPKGKNGSVTLPLNVYVTDGKREKIATDNLKVTVDVALENPISYFSAVKSLSFAIPEGARPADYQVFVGFDRHVANAG